MNYIDLFVAEAQKSNARAAVVDRESGRTTSYGELDRLSSLAAGKLHAAGCGEGDFVVILMGRCMEYVAAYLGAMKAGCAVVPLTEVYPQERVDFIFRDCNAKQMIRQDFFDDIAEYEAYYAPAGDDSPALAVYTSGSTGNPKGVCHSVSGLCSAALRQKNDLFKGYANCRSSVVAPFSFIANFVELYVQFLFGNTVFIMPDEAKRSSELMMKFFESNQIEMACVPMQLLRFVDEKRLKHMKLMWTGSEAVSNVSFSDFTLVNVYGQSETVLGATAYIIDRPYEMTPIGKPLNGLTAYILDEDGKEVADGETGEICIEGAFGVCYLNDPERTAKTFIKLENGNTLIHTGDIAYRNENGDMVYVSRKDWMVKVNGQRVEMLEVERRLSAIDGIAAAAVRAWTDRNRQTYIAGYYQPNGEISEEQIRAALRKTLPDYMIPRFLVRMDALPKNINGKLDRRALPEPELDSYRAEYKAPANETERLLCESFAAVLSCGKTGADDDFIALGGDSIKVLKLLEAAALEGLSADLILRGRTPRKIAALLGEKARPVLAHCDELPEFCLLTESQRGVYLECVSEPESTMYNLPFRCKLPHGTDTRRLAEAVRAAIAAHPAFEAVIRLREYEPVMYRVPHEIRVETAEIDSLAEAERTFVRPFDLENGPLYRAAVWHGPQGNYLALDFHHVIFDGSSVSVFMDDVARAYCGEALADEALTLFDVAACEQAQSSGESEEARTFFENLLNGADTDCMLSHDAPKDAPCGSDTLHIDMLLKPEQLNRFAQQNGLTVNTVLMGAFAYTLARYGGAKESLFCTADSGRHDSRLGSTVGMFVRTLPIHVSFTEETAVIDYLRGLQDTFFEELRFDGVSFGELVKKYGISNRISFIYQSHLLRGAELPCGSLLPQEIERGSSQTDMDFMVNCLDDRFNFSVHFRKNVYTEALLRRFARVYENVVRGMLTAKTLGGIVLVDAKEEALLTSFAGVKVPYDSEKTVLDFFAESVSRWPEREAVIFEDKRLTYAQLDELTDRLSAELVRRGIGREQVVSVLIPRSEWMAVVSLGILKAGAAYQPLDSSYPPERLAFMMKDAGAVLLIADSTLLSMVPERECPVLRTDELATLPAAEKTACLPKPDDLFLLLYTSGSTGTPKGCMIEHRNVAAYCGYICRYYGMTQEDRVLAYASYGFDANLMDMYPTWMCGAALYIASEELRLDLPRLSDYIRENGITRAFMTTQVGRMIAVQEKDVGLKTLMMGGEKLVPFTPKPGCRYLNGYGPSECVCASSVYEITKFEDDLPIGKPVENLELYVLDEQGRRMPVGVPGELCVSGPQVSRGYLNRPEKTAEVFVPNPFGKEAPYLRMYRTGDVVRFLPDGNLLFVGRRDGQVKVRGFRVELSEVEEVIRRFRGIKDATVAAFEEPGGGKYIAAYVVSDEAVDEIALHAFIRERKPPYMVPAVTVQLPAIPLTQNSKVNKKALPVPQRKAEHIVPPETDLQQRIFDLCAEAVGHTSFGIDTDLFEAGLSSIGTLKLNMLLGESFHTAMRLDDLKRCSTVRTLEAFLGGVRETAAHNIQADYPLTQTQQGIFVECCANPDTVLYNIPLLMKLCGEIDGSRLAAAAEAAVNAHPYLKAVLFADSTGTVRARRQDDAAPTVQHLVCDVLPDKNTLVRPFQLLDAPLYRAAVYSTKDGTYLFLDIHHILSDGTSEAILLRDIDRAYAGEALEKENYTGFEAALDEEEARKGEQYQNAKAYYDSVFAECESDALPPKCPEDSAGGAASVTHICAVPASEVTDCCKRIKATPNAFMNAAFGYALSRFGMARDAVFTTVYNGRSDSRLANAVTMLVKTLPVLVRTETDRPAAELIGETQTQLMNSMANDLFSFAEISNAYGIRADVMMVYQGDSFRFDTLCGIPAETVPVLPSVAKAPITVNVNLVNGRFEFAADYRRDLYNEVFLRSLLDAFEQVIAGFVGGKKLSEIRMLSACAEKRLSEVNDTARSFDAVPAARLFEKHAAAHPDRLAVVDCDRRMTYAELDRAANRAAHALIRRGVTNDTVVCLLLDRTIDISLTELAILKAGGAFLGVLPSYPDERIEFCLRDSGCPLVITSADVLADRPALFGEDKPYRAVPLDTLLACAEDTVPDICIPPDSLAFCIYTSGSTGKPKGVMIAQRNLVCCAQPFDFDYRFYHGDRSGEVGLALSSISFDMSVFDNLLLLLNGKTVCIASEDEIHNPERLAQLMLDNGVTMMATTPSVLTNYISGALFRKAISQLKTIVVGAEAFQASLYDSLKAINPSLNILNGYGPTECTMTCSSKLLTGSADITIGGPAANTAFYVLDGFGNLLPPYACGELIICGDLVGRGYINLPDKTKAAFFTLNGLPAYHSGDVVRLNAAGEVEIFGRMDNQVKLRGFRVELDEIEKAFCSYPGIRQSKVIVRNNGSEDYLAGYFTADTQVDLSALTQHLKSILTYYMVPDVMLQLEAMPLTPSGKIDRKALPELRKERKKSGHRAARKSLEQELCEIFKSVLGLEEYYADDSFFEMGGTSLTASKVTMQLMAKEIRVEYQNLFDYPTPEELAAFIQSQHSEKPQEAAAEKNNAPSEIAALLEHNTLAHAAEVRREPLGDVLLTGAVGFLGIHVLRELIERKEGRILCLVRKGNTESAEKRLKNMLVYYFSDSFDREFADRIRVVDADITDDNLSDTLRDLHFDTLINCAACVKHFAADDAIERINVHGVENLIRCAMEQGARLIQISTTSVPGVHTEDTYRRQVKLHENELFVVDDTNNKYIISKYRAEMKVLEGIRNGLRGKIIRVGNLMGRHSDGEFQINFNTNAFMDTLRGFATLGKCPISHATDPMSFSPIDLTAKVIVLLSGTNDEFTAFHANNRFSFDEMQLIEAANESGITILPVSDEEYYADFYRALGNESVNKRMSGLMTNDRPDLHAVDTDNLFTAGILYRLGFSWPLVDKDYLRKALQSLLTLGFFD